MISEHKRVDLQQAFVLHTRVYQETKLWVECYTEEFGRVSLLAHGASGKTSKRRALLQPFSELLISWKAKGDFLTLNSIEPNFRSVKPIRLQARKLIAGLYVNELMLYFHTVMDSDSRVFNLYRNFLCQLTDVEHWVADLRYFEKKLLEYSGHGLQLAYECNSGDVIDATQHYIYESGCGLKLASDTTTMTFSGDAIIAFAKHQLCSNEQFRCAKRLTRRAIDEVLEGRQLKTRELLSHF